MPNSVLPQKPEGPDWLMGLAKVLLPQRSWTVQTAITLAAIILSTGIRYVLDTSLPAGFPFLTFFPAVLVTALFASVRAGIVVAVVCGLISWYMFIPPLYSFHLNGGSGIAMGFYTVITATELAFIAATNHALRLMQWSEAKAATLAKSRELMFNELQHRVSNNLATVAALLRMQAGRTTDPEAKQALADAQVRISTISRLQRRLHSPNIQWIDVPSFLKDLSQDALEAAGTAETAGLTLELAPLRIAHDKAIPLGLITSELVMNAVEHGGRDGAVPDILIRLQTRETEVEGQTFVAIEVADRGAGLAEDFDLSQTRSLGLAIARQFAAQLGGELSMSNRGGGGTASRLEFVT